MKRSRPGLNNVYFFLCITSFLLVAGGAVYILLADYDTLIQSIITSTGKNGLDEKIRTQIFPLRYFKLLQYAACLIIVAASFSFWLALRYKHTIIKFLRFIIISVVQSVQQVYNVFKNNSTRQNREVWVIIVITGLFFIYVIANTFLNYDEMWSYNYYTVNPFYYAFFTYSGYPLFELSTHFFKWLPFSMKINLRLSSWLFGLASFFLLYACLRKYLKDHFAAILGLLFFACMPVAAGYMIVARGVMHELFFAIAGIFSFLFWINNPQQKNLLVIYFIAAVLGVYSMPTHCILLFLLLFAGLLILFKRDKGDAFLFVKVNLFALVAIILIYLPVLAVTGISVFKGIVNSQNSSRHFLQFPGFAKDLLLFYTGYSHAALLLFVIVSAGLLLIRKKIPGNFGAAVIVTIGLPVSGILFYLVTGIRYPDRSLSFGALAIPLIVSLIAYTAAARFNINHWWKTIVILCTGIAGLALDSHLYNTENKENKNVFAVAGVMMNKKIESCYDNSSAQSNFFYYYPGIEYYYRVKEKKIVFNLSTKNSMRYKPLLPEDKYDCIVYDLTATDSSRTFNYYEAYRDTAGKFKVWVRNDLK